MQSSGSGLTFNDQDIVFCRIVIGLITKAKYELKAPEIVESAKGLVWIEDLLKNMKDNVLDFSTAKMVEPGPQQEPTTKRGKK